MLKKRKKILSFLTAAVLAAALLPATTIVTSADNGNIIFEDNFTTGFDFSANGYTTPGNSTLEAEGLKISTGLGQVTSFSKNLSTPITTGRTVLEIEFKFDPLKIWVDGNHGGINYNFPDITSSDNVRYAATNLTGETSKLANTAIVDGVIYKYAVDFDITAPENGGSYKTYNVHLYKKNQSGTWDEIARVLGKTINAGFYDSITKDIGKIGFTIGGEDQVMYLYALKAYTLSAENLIYEEPYLYKAGTAYTDKYGNGEYFQADGKPEYTNNSLKISTWSASAESGEDGKPLIPANGGNVRPGIPHIDAVDNLTVETTFTTGNIVLNKADWFMVLTSHPYSQHSPFRANIVNGALNYSNGVSNFPIGSALLPNKSYTLKTIMNFTSQTLDVYLLNVENNKIMYKNNFPFSYSSHNSGGVSGTWENLGFDYLVYNFGDNGSNTKDNPGVMYLDNIKITVSSQETEADTNIIINDTYDEFDEGYVPTTVQGYSGINAQNIAVDSEGRLKISRTPGEVGGWIRTLPETVDSGKVVAEFEFEFENDPVKVTSYAFPAVRATDGAGLIQPQIVNEKELKPNGETAYILAGGIKYRQVFVIDFDGESVKRYIYNLTSGAIEICNIRDISGLTVKNFTDLQFLLTNDDTAVQNRYLDTLQVYRRPELKLEGLSYNGVEIEDGGILSGTAD
jgi:hypothetical protein